MVLCWIVRLTLGGEGHHAADGMTADGMTADAITAMTVMTVTAAAHILAITY